MGLCCGWAVMAAFFLPPGRAGVLGPAGTLFKISGSGLLHLVPPWERHLRTALTLLVPLWIWCLLYSSAVGLLSRFLCLHFVWEAWGAGFSIRGHHALTALLLLIGSSALPAVAYVLAFTPLQLTGGASYSTWD